MLLRGPSEKVFDQSICRTKEQKTRLKCLMPKCASHQQLKMAKFLRRKNARVWQC